MGRFVPFRILFWVGWYALCVLAEEVSTNEVSAGTISNNVPLLATNPLPIQVEVPVAAEPLSADLEALLTELEVLETEDAGLFIAILVAGLSERQEWACDRSLRQWMLGRAAAATEAPAPELDGMLLGAACTRCIGAFQGSDVRTEVWEWLFSSSERIRFVAETLQDEDRAPAAAKIIEQLYMHDPQARDHFLNLILAMAFVWDTPRKAMDDQLEPGWLPPDEDITLYYDYFKRLYSSSKAKVAYEELSVDSLVFVVDVPAPVSELEWALENVAGTRSSWGRHYQSIPYDHLRIYRDQYDWPHKEYTLKEIQECFGICVDQAHYCVLTARAHGIPCLFFRGCGTYGRHAWFGFMKRRNEWDFEVGRYSKQGYATGFAVHPQADYEMSDHDLEYVGSRSVNPEVSRRSSALVYLAKVFCEEDCADYALVIARKALEVDPKCEAAWEMQCNLLADAGRFEEAVALEDEKAAVFRFFPDMKTEASQRQAILMNRAGDAEGATELLRRQVALVPTKRGDLQQRLVIAQASQLLRQGQPDKGMEAIEKVLREQRRDGFKVVSLMQDYKSFAKRAGCADKAVRFLKTY